MSTQSQKINLKPATVKAYRIPLTIKKYIFLKEIHANMSYKGCGRLTFGPKVKVLGMKIVYELPNPNLMVYSHDCEPLFKLNVCLVIRKSNDICEVQTNIKLQEMQNNSYFPFFNSE